MKKREYMEKIFYESQADKNDYFWTWYFEKNNTPPHFHKSLELIYCVKGSMRIFINKQYHILKQDEICFIPSYFIHANRFVDDDNVIHSFLFAHNYFHDFEKSFPQKNLPLLLLNHEANREFYRDLMNMFQIYASYDYYGDNIPFLQRQALINNLLLKLTQSYPLISYSKIKEDHSIIEILQYINENHQNELSIPVIAKQFNYSPKYFSNFFKRNVGCNFTEYIHNIRIKNILLQYEAPKNQKSISSLALDNGFKSLATFYRVLKQFKQELPPPTLPELVITKH